MVSLLAFGKLFLNPYFYIAMGIASMISFGSGSTITYKIVKAGQLQAQNRALRQAADDSAKIASEDSRRAVANALEAERYRDELQQLVEKNKPGACKLSAAELAGLQRLSR